MFWQRAIRGSCHKICKLWERHASASVVGVHQRYLLGSTRACSGLSRSRYFDGKDIIKPGEYKPEYSHFVRLRTFDPKTGKELKHRWNYNPEYSDLVPWRFFNPKTGEEITNRWEYNSAICNPLRCRFFDSDTGEELVNPGNDKAAWDDLDRAHPLSIDFGNGVLVRIHSRWNQLAPGIRQPAKTAGSAIACLHFMQGGKLFGESSGTVIHPSGLILTCAQALGSLSKSKEDLAKLKVSVAVDPHNGGVFSYNGVVLYADFHYDIAIIKISSKCSLEAARLGSLYELCPSSSVLYLGSYTWLTNCRSYPQFYIAHCELISGQTITVDQGGILEHLLPVSLAPTPNVDPLAPTDASGEMATPLGGPLVNPRGEVVGMISNRYGKNYALSIDLIRKIIDHFVKYGRVIRPWLGLRLTFPSTGCGAQIEEENILIHNISKGFLVVKVIPGSPSDRAGFLPGDVVVEIDGKCIGSLKELTDVLWDKVGVPLEVIVKRSTDRSMTLTVVPEEASADASESEHTTDLG